MSKDQLELYLSRLKGSVGGYPFGTDALVFKVMGKVFALVSQTETTSRVTLKCSPADGEVLESQFESVVPGYHMNKKHWITIALTGELPDELLTDLAEGSYKLVISKLTTKDRSRLESQ